MALTELIQTKKEEKRMEKTEKLIADVIGQIGDWKGEDLTYERWPDFFMWNCNWKVSVNGKKYFVKIPGEKSELFFNRDHIHEACVIAADSGVGPAVPYYLKDSGVEISEWLENYSGLRTDKWIFQHRFEEKFLFKSLDLLKKLHNSGQELSNKKNIFDQIRDLSTIMDKNSTFEIRERSYLENLVNRIEEAISANGGMDLKPCINNICDRWSWDFMWNESEQDLKIVDYEWASMNDVCSDLATLSTSAMLYDDHDKELVEYYFGELNEFQFARFKLFKILVLIKSCFFISILDKFRPAAFDYIRSYGWKMARLRNLLHDPRTENWIWSIKNQKGFDNWKGYPLA
jgi:thiamine kinase-like enzyme